MRQQPSTRELILATWNAGLIPETEERINEE
jgi:hypothetical protein